MIGDTKPGRKSAEATGYTKQPLHNRGESPHYLHCVISVLYGGVLFIYFGFFMLPRGKRSPNTQTRPRARLLICKNRNRDTRNRTRTDRKVCAFNEVELGRSALKRRACAAQGLPLSAPQQTALSPVLRWTGGDGLRARLPPAARPEGEG